MLPMLSKIHSPVLFCLVLCANFPLRAQQTLKPFSSDVTYTANGETHTGKIYSDGHSVRIELEGRLPAKNEISFVRLDSGVGQALGPFMSAYIEYPYGNSSDAQFVRYLPDAKVRSRSLGSDLVDGQSCEKVSIMASYRGNTYSSIEWRSHKLNGLVVRSQDADGQWSTEYRNVRLGTQSASLFEIPASYTRIAYSRDWRAVSTQINFAEETSDEIAIAKRAGLRVLEHTRVLPEDNPSIAEVQFSDPVTKSSIVDPTMDPDTPWPPRLPAPSPQSPENGTVFDRAPHKVELRWNPVADAAAYYIRVVILPMNSSETAFWAIDRGLTYVQTSTRENKFAFELDDARPGRWQVRAVDTHGALGKPSAWSTFEFRQ